MKNNLVGEALDYLLFYQLNLIPYPLSSCEFNK